MEKVVSIILIVIIMTFAIWWLIRSWTEPLVPPRKETEPMIDEVKDKAVELSNETSTSEQIIEEDMEQMNITLPDTTTRTSLMVALRKVNLQYDFDEDQQFLVTYQGECFRIIAENEHAWIHIQDCWWYRESLDDIDNLALLHRAVNECNIRDVNKIVYTYNKEEREIGLHILRDIIWLPQIPDSDQYLQTTFDTMLRSHHFFFRMMENLRKEEFARNH